MDLNAFNAVSRFESIVMEILNVFDRIALCYIFATEKKMYENVSFKKIRGICT